MAEVERKKFGTTEVKLVAPKIPDIGKMSRMFDAERKKVQKSEGVVKR